MRLSSAKSLLLAAAAACGIAGTATASSLAAPGAQHPRTLSGVVTYLNGPIVTIQTAGRRVGVINALTMAADAINRRDYPYVWGGGHAMAGVADAGDTGGHGRKHTGYDCSGAVAAVLSGAGLWPAGSGVPADNGVIDQLLQQGLIARGPGTGPNSVTLYDHPGVHIFMNIDGRFFGTSDGGGGGNPAGGAGWLYDGAPDASSRAFREYHILPSVLRDHTTYGHSYTFQDAGGADLTQAFLPGDKVDVQWVTARNGSLIERAISWRSSSTTTGTVVSIAADGQSFVITTPDGHQVTLAVGSPISGTVLNLQPGEQVQITYTKGRQWTARALQVTSAPPVVTPAQPAPGTTTPGATTPGTTTPGPAPPPYGSPAPQGGRHRS